MTKEHVASWLMEHSSVPQTVLKPVATRLGLSTNYLGAAIFAGQLVYENQEVIVKYANKGGITVGEFLYERSRERYGEGHPLTQHLGANLDAITEAFEGTEEEALTFAEFYRQYRAVDSDFQLPGRGQVPSGLDVFETVRDAMPGPDSVPDRGSVPGPDALPGFSTPELSVPELAMPELGSGLDSDIDADESDAVEIPVTDGK